MPFLDHLEEFRQRLFRILGAFLIVSIICFTMSERFVEILLGPAKDIVPTLVFLKPTEAFMVHIKVSLVAGFIIASPYILYQIWLFIMPGLYRSEKRIVLPLTLISLVLFVIGVSFAYFGVVRFGLSFLMGYATDTLHGTISIGAYISLVTTLFLAFGVIFELPLVILALNQLGLVSTETLKAKRPVAVVAIFIVAAVITPPDVITQLLMGFPLVFLYEISIWSAVIINKFHKNNKTAEADDAPTNTRNKPAKTTDQPSIIQPAPESVAQSQTEYDPGDMSDYTSGANNDQN